ncbi:MAG: sigma-70 family RNA polymerase sigma factor [Anaerolineales bacterium]|nr:sigma-70 family RNA polymerase sigma factor [Anaerolineales bacterium]
MDVGELSLEALKTGDRAEFARMVDAYSNQVYRVALKILGDEQDAEDVLQDTFLKALQSLSAFEGRSSISTWLYRIAVNEALMLLRRQKPEIQVVPDEQADEDDFTLVQFVDWCCLPESELLSTEAQVYLEQAVRDLPEKLRLVFILRDMEGLSIHETSEALGLSETAVKTRLLRARLKLREQLSTYYGERLGKEKV